jgi:hypothetical protein
LQSDWKAIAKRLQRYCKAIAKRLHHLLTKPYTHAGNEYFARLVFRLVHRHAELPAPSLQELVTLMRTVASDMGAGKQAGKFVAEQVEKGVAKFEEATDESKPLGKEVRLHFNCVCISFAFAVLLQCFLFSLFFISHFSFRTHSLLLGVRGRSGHDQHGSIVGRGQNRAHQSRQGTQNLTLIQNQTFTL